MPLPMNVNAAPSSGSRTISPTARTGTVVSAAVVETVPRERPSRNGFAPEALALALPFPLLLLLSEGLVERLRAVLRQGGGRALEDGLKRSGLELRALDRRQPDLLALDEGRELPGRPDVQLHRAEAGLAALALELDTSAEVDHGGPTAHVGCPTRVLKRDRAPVRGRGLTAVGLTFLGSSRVSVVVPPVTGSVNAGASDAGRSNTANAAPIAAAAARVTALRGAVELVVVMGRREGIISAGAAPVQWDKQRGAAGPPPFAFGPLGLSRS